MSLKIVRESCQNLIVKKFFFSILVTTRGPYLCT